MNYFKIVKFNLIAFIILFTLKILASSYIPTPAQNQTATNLANSVNNTLAPAEQAINSAVNELANAAEQAVGYTIDETVSILSNISCETQGISDLLRSEFSHTCIPAPYSTLAVANILSPGLYANALLKLRMNDDNVPDLLGNCTRANRIDPNSTNPSISFGVCNNVELGNLRLQAIANSTVAIAAATLTGTSPWDAIKDSWNISEASYVDVYTGKDGDQFTLFDIGILPVMPLKIMSINDKICVATIGITGWIPVGCKYFSEPFPVSMYDSFNNPNADTNNSAAVSDPYSLTQCSNIGSCYLDAYKHSQTGLVMTAPLIECVKQMTAKLLISNNTCEFNSNGAILTNNSSVLFQFQTNMHRAVIALLTIYVIFFGIKLILGSQTLSGGEVITFIIKLILVIYFSIGINVNGSGGERLDGMTSWIFPFLLSGISEIASWVINASPSELCQFNSSDYANGYDYIALWDALDCRISHYIGLDVLKNMQVQAQLNTQNHQYFDNMNFPVPPYLYLLIPAVLTGQTTLIGLALMYPLLVISVAAYVVNTVVVCMIMVVILGMLAPVFVPMCLFQYTRNYFDAWVKLLISFLIQPFVAAVFITAMFAMYDYGFYGACSYNVYTVQTSSDDGARNTKIYLLNTDLKTYSDTDAKSCSQSLGFLLNNPQTALYDYAQQGSVSSTTATTQAGSATVQTGTVTSSAANLNTTDNSSIFARFGFLGGLVSNPGMIFTFPTVIFEVVKQIILALVIGCLMLYLMYNFSAQLADFAADITEGISLKNITIKPQTIFKAGMAAAGAAGKAGAVAGKIGTAAGKVGSAAASKAASASSTSARKLLSSAGSKLSNYVSNKTSQTAQDFSSSGGGSNIRSSSSNSSSSSDNQSINNISSARDNIIIGSQRDTTNDKAPSLKKIEFNIPDGATSKKENKFEKNQSNGITNKSAKDIASDDKAKVDSDKLKLDSPIKQKQIVENSIKSKTQRRTEDNIEQRRNLLNKSKGNKDEN